MADETFEAFIARDRERINGERAAIFDQQETLQQRLDALNKELAAITAYEDAKAGRQPPRHIRQAPNGSQRRTRKGSRREEIIEAIRQSPGMSRGDLLDKMGLKNDKAGEMSVSNALTALVKANQLRREGGKYHVG